MRYRRVRLGERDAYGCGPVVRRSIGRNRRRLGTRKTDRLYRSGAPNDTVSILELIAKVSGKYRMPSQPPGEVNETARCGLSPVTGR